MSLFQLAVVFTESPGRQQTLSILPLAILLVTCNQAFSQKIVKSIASTCLGVDSDHRATSFSPSASFSKLFVPFKCDFLSCDNSF